MITLSGWDIGVILVYFAAVLIVGFRTVKRTTSEEEDFLLAGRSLTLPVFVMTLVSTWYGGILGVGEFSYRYGISNWVVQGAPYYVFAAVFAVFLAEKIRATNFTSIPDKLHDAYDRRTAVAGGILTFVLMTPAPYILMLAVFLQMLFGWGLLTGLIVATVTTASYLVWGGFRADVETDVLEFFLMFIGFAMILPFAWSKFGGIGFLTSHLPPLHLVWHGGNGAQFILVWFLIALWTLVDPAFHQRCYAASSGRVARRGILISIIFWFVFDFMTAAAGLYARAAIPNLAEPMMAYPMLAEVLLPTVAKGLFYVGMLATIMSTLNTLVLVSAQTLGRDIYLRVKSPGLVATPGHSGGSPMSARSTQAGLVVSLVLSIACALAIPSVVRIWYTIGTIIVPGLLVPLVAGYTDRWKMSAPAAFAAMLAGCLTSLVWFLAGSFNGGNYPLGVEPMIPGIAATLVCWGVGRDKQP